MRRYNIDKVVLQSIYCISYIMNININQAMLRDRRVTNVNKITEKKKTKLKVQEMKHSQWSPYFKNIRRYNGDEGRIY